MQFLDEISMMLGSSFMVYTMHTVRKLLSRPRTLTPTRPVDP